ncbi:MAG: NAD-dependent epimerase/dehydratase family protein [Euryarchaeota archaeon]|nr:NAD-dependent epimerase/dehydratase family protein [Euryarchaeota archaeon]
MRCIVTGGAGFIGSHLTDALVAQGEEVIVIDSLITGTKEHLFTHIADESVIFIEKDLCNDDWMQACAGVQRIYHLAADPDVRASAEHPKHQLQNTIIATHQVLEAMRQYHVPELIFTSTSTVYGEAMIIPTPETYTPMEPVSVYGASKLACEALISAYCHSFGIQSWIYRFANIVGARSGHGVIYDFIKKLQKNPSELEILGDGKQAKSYLSVSACVQAMLFGVEHAKKQVNYLNIGSDDWIDVTTIAEIIIAEMGLSSVTFQYTGGNKGWVGDVARMQLSCDAMKTLGWQPSVNSYESVVQAVHAALSA